MMNLYFVPNDPENTTLVSANGVAQYRVITSKPSALRGTSVTTITRPSDKPSATVLARIDWKKWGGHPLVRSSIFDGTETRLEVRELLYKVGSTFSTYVTSDHLASCSNLVLSV